MAKTNLPDMVPFNIISLLKMGEQMRAAADKYPDDESPVYSNTEVEAVEKAKWQVENQVEKNGQWQIEVGLCRVVDRRDQGCLISVTISKEVFCTPHQYRVSMVKITGPAKFERVNPQDAALIAACLLGQKVDKVPNPSGIESATHFVRVLG